MFRNPTIDLIVVLIIVLLILGPKRLPGLGKGLGQGMREFKEAITGESKDEEEQQPAILRARHAGSEPSASDAGGPTADRGSAEVGSSAPVVMRRGRQRRVGRATWRAGAQRWRRFCGPSGTRTRLSIVDHLDELRSRLFVCLAALVVAFGLCFWQNQALLDLLNKPLPTASPRRPTTRRADRANGQGAPGVDEAATAVRSLAGLPELSAAGARGDRSGARPTWRRRQGAAPEHAAERPITIGVGEPFTTTLTVCFYFAILFTLPVLLYEVYAFVVPALSPNERRIASPLMIAAPALFMIGVVFTYLSCCRPRSSSSRATTASTSTLVQAKPLYTFEVVTMGAIGLAFQLPLVLLGLHRLGVINGSTLTRHWRYATVIIAVIAAAMPGADPVTTGLETPRW